MALGQGSLLDDETTAELAPGKAPEGPPTGESSASAIDRWRYAKVIGSVVAVGLCVLVISRQVSNLGDPRGESNSRVVIDSETGEVFPNYRVRENDGSPYVNSSTGRRTLVPAEKCFWTRDGKAKLKPTYVLLNEYAGRKGPTMCPDCGRPVVGRNPPPPMELLSEAATRESGGK